MPENTLVKSKVHTNGTGRDVQSRSSKVEIYTTAREYTVKILGLSPFHLQDIYESMKSDPDWPEPDTKKVYYEYETVSGAMERHEHNDDTEKTPEEAIAYESYLTYKASYESELSNRIFNAALLEGIEVQGVDYDAMQEKWAKRRLRSGGHIPEDDVDREIYFIKTVIVGNVDDLGHIFERVMARTGLDTSALVSTRSMFPGGVEDEARPDAIGELIDTRGAMDSQ